MEEGGDGGSEGWGIGVLGERGCSKCRALEIDVGCQQGVGGALWVGGAEETQKGEWEGVAEDWGYYCMVIGARRGILVGSPWGRGAARGE